MARATDPRILERGQDGGAVTALLAWGLDTDEIDGAVVAAPSDDVAWLDEPKVVRTQRRAPRDGRAPDTPTAQHHSA